MDILESASKKVIIVSHTGSFGPMIPNNSMKAYQIAVAHGADMIETDISRSMDGTLFIMHPKQEPKNLNSSLLISELHDDQIFGRNLYTTGGTLTEFVIPTLDEVFEEFKDKCFINIDKFINNPAPICECIKRHNIADQCIVKSAPTPEVLDLMEEYAPEIPFMPVIREAGDTHEMLLSRNINYIGSELLFDTDDHEFITGGYVEKLHSAGKLAWVNSIVYSVKVVLAAGHSDVESLAKDPDNGWGWLVDHGFDIIQTDWVLAMKQYLETSGKLFK